MTIKLVIDFWIVVQVGHYWGGGATLCQLFKIVYKLCSSPNPYNPHPRPGLRNLNSMALDTPFCRLSLTQKSFYPYAPSLWNYLPDSAVTCPTLTAFKSAIIQLFC